MSITLRCVSAGVLVLNCGATGEVHIQKYQPNLSFKRRPHFHVSISDLRTNKDLVIGVDRPYNQELLCLRLPVAMYCYAVLRPATYNDL
jgi:hypothetical protein